MALQLWADAQPPCKRRRLPASFRLADELDNQRRSRAAVRLSRFWRWRRSLRDATDPISFVPLLPRHTLRLVEPGGGVHNYDALTLARYCLATGHFLTPLTRRELTELELLRLQKRCCVVDLRALLHTTYLVRHAIAQAEMRRGMLHMVVASDVGEALERVLDTAEASPCCDDWETLQLQVQAYEFELARFAEHFPEELATVCRNNEDIARRRGFFCPEALLADLCATHAAALRLAPVGRRRPSLAFGRLLQDMPWAPP